MAKTPEPTRSCPLVEDYPQKIESLTLLGLRLRAEITVSVVIRENGDSETVGLWFIGERADGSDCEETIVVAENVRFTHLPEMQISTADMAEAMEYGTGFTCEEIIRHVFARTICKLGSVAIEIQSDEEVGDEEVRLSIEAGTFRASVICSLALLSDFLEVADDNNGADEGVPEEEP